MKRDIHCFILFRFQMLLHDYIFKIRICAFTITYIRRIICFNRDSFNKMRLILDLE